MAVFRYLVLFLFLGSQAVAANARVWSVDLMNGDDRFMFDLLEGFHETTH